VSVNNKTESCYPPLDLPDDHDRILWLNGEVRRLRDMINASEKRGDVERSVLKVASDKADQLIDERLDAMNNFSSLIKSERASYVTRDLLDAKLEQLQAQVTALDTRVTAMGSYDNGRNSTIYNIIAIGASVVAVVIAALLH
jgi:hypothetical protein